MPAPLESFSFGTLERFLRPQTFEQIRRYGVQREQADEASGMDLDGKEGGEEPRVRRRWVFEQPAQPTPFDALPIWLFEEGYIFGDLLPVDLFNLSLVSQNLFCFFRSKAKSATYWRKSIEAERSMSPSLFDLMEERSMSPVEYAFLVGGTWCQYCLKSYQETDIILWSPLRVRCCLPCAKRIFAKEDDILSRFSNLHYLAFECSTFTPCKTSAYEYRSAYVKYRTEMIKSQPRAKLALEIQKAAFRHLRRYDYNADEGMWLS
ncbi:hypothetical protein JCM6882_008655 [Rhodosporidiobolus microsporus]